MGNYCDIWDAYGGGGCTDIPIMYPEDLGLGVIDCAIWLKWLGHSDRGAILGPETMLRGCGGGRVKIHP